MNQTEQNQIREVVDDGAKLVQHGKEAVAAFRKEGVAGAIREASEAIPDVQETIRDVTAALPTIKAGYKSTEFWLVLVFFIGNGVLAAMGKPLPFEVNAVLGSVLAVYAVVRTAFKAKAVVAAV